MKSTIVEQTIISLVRSALDDSVASVSSDIDWCAVFEIGKAHKLIPLIYSGITKSNIEIPSDAQTWVDKALLSYFLADQTQQTELKRLQQAFENEGVDYMPVKGVLLKPLYPSTDFRPMGDADILIRIGQKDKAFEIMQNLGYIHLKDSAHEFIFGKAGMHIELHKCLVPPYNEDYYSYFGDGWQRANQIGQTTRYELSDNDHYIYMFTHFAKHYRDGGISALHLIDFWIYKQSKNLDEDYIRSELSNLSLEKFYDNITATIQAWFGGASPNEMTEFITKRIFSNGTWGTKETKLQAKGAKAAKSGIGAGVKMAINVVFPSVEKLQFRFPVLEKHKYLLPVMWVVRWFDVLLFKRGKIHERMDEVKHVDNEFVSSYQKELDYVGLDFNYKE